MSGQNKWTCKHLTKCDKSDYMFNEIVALSQSTIIGDKKSGLNRFTIPMLKNLMKWLNGQNPSLNLTPRGNKATIVNEILKICRVGGTSLTQRADPAPPSPSSSTKQLFPKGERSDVVIKGREDEGTRYVESFKEYFANLMNYPSGEIPDEESFNRLMALKISEELGTPIDLQAATTTDEKKKKKTVTISGKKFELRDEFSEFEGKVLDRVEQSILGFVFGEILGMNIQTVIDPSDDGRVRLYMFGKENSMPINVGHDIFTNLPQGKRAEGKLFPFEFFKHASTQLKEVTGRPFTINSLPLYPLLGARINRGLAKIFEKINARSTTVQSSLLHPHEADSNALLQIIQHTWEEEVVDLSENISVEKRQAMALCCPDNTWLGLVKSQEFGNRRWYTGMQRMFPIANYMAMVGTLAFDKYKVPHYFGGDDPSEKGLNLFRNAIYLGVRVSELSGGLNTDADVISGLFCGILLLLSYPDFYPSSEGKPARHDPIELIKKYIYAWTSKGEFHGLTIPPNLLNRLLQVTNSTLNNPGDITTRLANMSPRFGGMCFGSVGGTTMEQGQHCNDEVLEMYAFFLASIKHMVDNVDYSAGDLLVYYQKNLYNYQNWNVSAFVLSIIGGLAGLIKPRQQGGSAGYQVFMDQYMTNTAPVPRLRDNDYGLGAIGDRVKMWYRKIERTMVGNVRDLQIVSKIEVDVIERDVEEIRQLKVPIDLSTSAIIDTLSSGLYGMYYSDFTKNGFGNMIWRLTQPVNDYVLNPFTGQSNISQQDRDDWINILNIMYPNREWGLGEVTQMPFVTPVCEPYMATWAFHLLKGFNLTTNKKEMNIANNLLFMRSLEETLDNVVEFENNYLYYDENLCRHGYAIGDATFFTKNMMDLLSITKDNRVHSIDDHPWEMMNFGLNTLHSVRGNLKMSVPTLFRRAKCGDGTRTDSVTDTFLGENTFLMEMRPLCQTPQTKFNQCPVSVDSFYNRFDNDITEKYGELFDRYPDSRFTLQMLNDALGENADFIHESLMEVSDHKMNTISEMYYAFPVLIHSVLYDYHYSLTLDNPAKYLKNIVQNPKHTKGGFQPFINVSYKIQMQNKLRIIYSLTMYMVYETYFFEKNGTIPKFNIGKYDKMSKTLLGGRGKRSPLREGWSLDDTLLKNLGQQSVDEHTIQNYSGNLTLREIGLYKKSEDTTSSEGDSEFYILGSFLAELSQIMEQPPFQRQNPHDLLLKYIERYGGARRGIISPLLGFFYGLIVQATTQDSNLILSSLENRLGPYNNHLNMIKYQTSDQPSFLHSIREKTEIMAENILQSNNFVQFSK